MARKKKKQDAGVPDWMVTYGDMMTLLFCFFVIIVSMSEIKEDDKFQRVLESIQKAFGYKGGAGATPSRVVPSNTFDQRKQQLIMRKFQLQIGKSTDEGIQGENPSVKVIRDGMEFAFGGQVSFEPGQARLLDTAKVRLKEFSQEFKGMNTRIRIRGHASQEVPVASGQGPQLDSHQDEMSLDELSFARAMAVKDFLIENDIAEERMTVEGCGNNEPLLSQAYDEKSKAQNRRVAIVVTEDLVQTRQGKPATETTDRLF
ncbi:MAG: OmpA family protein [Phycisphaerae bacterium]|nr:OmpA family protein [Phycisphaerae bacterium]